MRYLMPFIVQSFTVIKSPYRFSQKAILKCLEMVKFVIESEPLFLE